MARIDDLCLSHAAAVLESPNCSKMVTRDRDITVYREAAQLKVCPRLAQCKTLTSCLMVLRSSAFLQRTVWIPHTSICVG